jgi:hypothetical protein
LVGVLGVRGLCVGVRAIGVVGELGDVVDLGIVLLRVRRNVGDCGLRVASPRSGDTGGLEIDLWLSGAGHPSLLARDGEPVSRYIWFRDAAGRPVYH